MQAQAQRANSVQWTALVLIAVLTLGVLFNVGNVLRVQDEKDIVVPTTTEIVDGVLAGIVIPVTDSDKLDEMYDDMFADNIKEDLAEDLVIDEVDSRNFLKEVFSALENEGQTIDNYRDITNIVVKDVDVTLNGRNDEKASVYIEAKVYYFVDGDEDEKERAIVEVTINVEELVEDDDFEDAEIDDDYSVDVIKVYD